MAIYHVKTILIAIVLISVVNGATAAPPKGGFAKEIEIVKHLLEMDLKDPASVQYRNVRIISKKSGSKTICGEYNARNSFGGYVGFKYFLAPTNAPLPKTDVDLSTWTALCLTDEAEAQLNSAKAAFAAQKEAEQQAVIQEARKSYQQKVCAEVRTAQAQANDGNSHANDWLIRECAKATKENASSQ